MECSPGSPVGLQEMDGHEARPFPGDTQSFGFAFLGTVFFADQFSLWGSWRLPSIYHGLHGGWFATALALTAPEPTILCHHLYNDHVMKTRCTFEWQSRLQIDILVTINMIISWIFFSHSMLMEHCNICVGLLAWFDSHCFYLCAMIGYYLLPEWWKGPLYLLLCNKLPQNSLA